MNRSRTLAAGLALAALCPLAPSQQVAPQMAPGRLLGEPSITVTPITGTSKTLQPGVSIANLDAGDLAAGRTWWEVQGIFYVETYVGFAWSPASGGVPFEIPQSLYFNDHIQSPSDIADEGTVVGVALFTSQFTSSPFRWTPAAGFEFLSVPGAGWYGGATAVSADGALIAGSLQQGVFGAPRAVRWVRGDVELIGALGEHSLTYDTSDDGRLIVGATGPDASNLRATRWFDGVELGLDPVPGETFSEALLAADTGGNVIGTATVGGQVLLARWRADGSAAAFAPPGGLSVEAIHAVDPLGRFAVGSLTDGLPFYQADWVPFLWSARDGFALLGELGRPADYDKSRAVDVSDDGKRVVGQLSSSVVSNGDPPTLGVLWTPEAGAQRLDDLLVDAGQAPLGLYDAVAISGDGRRILATGVVRPTPNDTSSVLLEFDLGPPLR